MTYGLKLIAPVDPSEAGSSELNSTPSSPLDWLSLVPRGKLIELSKIEASTSAHGYGARTTAAVSILRAVQREGDPVAWVAPRNAGLFPPDWERGGLDLRALLVVHVPEGDPRAAPRAAELIVRTGGFGAVVIDLGICHEFEAANASHSHGSRKQRVLPHGDAWMGRLLGLAREHDTRIILLSPKSEEHSSLGPLVAVRLAPYCAQNESGVFVLEPRVLKDKSGVFGTHISQSWGTRMPPPGLSTETPCANDFVSTRERAAQKKPSLVRPAAHLKSL